MPSKTTAFLLLVVLAGSHQLAAQPRTADEVIADCVRALGGEAAWQAIETLEIEGQHTSFNHTEPFLLLRKRPDLYRFDHNETTFEITHAYDGTTAWWRTDIPMFSKASWPVETPLPFTRAIELAAEFAMPFIGYREKGHQIEWVGETEYEGEPFLELRITRRQNPGAAERWFLDPQSSLPALRISEGTYHGYFTEQIDLFTDYRQVAGVVLPHVVETELGNDYLVLEISKVRANVEIDDRVFSRPLPAGMEKLQTLAGRWRVEIENRDDPAVNPELTKAWERHQTASVIHRRFDGSLLEEEILVATPRPRRLRRELTYDRFRDVFRITCFDSFSRHLDILEGELIDGRLVVSDRDTGTPIRIYDQTFHRREILYDLRPDSFRLDRETSTDGGETWQPDLRFTYTRMTDDR